MYRAVNFIHSCNSSDWEQSGCVHYTLIKAILEIISKSLKQATEPHQMQRAFSGSKYETLVHREFVHSLNTGSINNLAL